MNKIIQSDNVDWKFHKEYEISGDLRINSERNFNFQTELKRVQLNNFYFEVANYFAQKLNRNDKNSTINSLSGYILCQLLKLIHY